MTATGKDQRERLERRARLLEYATTVWNSTEAVITIATGLAAHSLGLIAFGLDSCVEVFASVVVLWHLRGGGDDEVRSRRAVRLIAIGFAVLAFYLGAAALHSWFSGAEPKRSWLGLGFLAATVVVMVLLAWAKRVTGTSLGNQPLVANARMTLLDGGLAAGILVAVFLAVEIGWWWADGLAAGLVAVVAAREAVDGWRGDPQD
jgi:divalent metal cation (Fe/Co/Zn/Cd) transporter